MDAQRLSILVVVGRIYSISKFSCPKMPSNRMDINMFCVEKRIFGIISKAADRGIVYYLCIVFIYIYIMVWS